MDLDLIARLIVSFDCIRNCPYCCNKYSNIINKAISLKGKLDLLKNYKTICVTGGEPLLHFKETKEIIIFLRNQFPKRKIYLYCAWYKKLEDIIEIDNLVDGIHFTLHDTATNEDLFKFDEFQLYLQDTFDENKQKSYRLYVYPSIKELTIYPYLWKRVEVKPWLNEKICVLPKNEFLFIYK
jgi:hypothetical protein